MKYKDYSVEDFMKDEFFVKWVKGDDPHVNDFWEKWIDANPEKRGIIHEAQHLILSLNYKHTHELSSSEYAALYEGILADDKKLGHNRIRTFKISRVAAVFLALIVSSAVLFYFYRVSNDSESSLAVTSIIKKTTEAGQKLSFKLPDGSKVKLNSASSISFQQTQEGLRHVKLKGEAFFEVAKDSLHPFVVETSNLSTTALGTSFNISAYPDDDDQKVSLLTGVVRVDKVSDNNESAESEILKPGDQVTYNRTQNDFHKTRFDIHSVIAWRKDIIVFKDTDFDTVISTLERWYGVEFEIVNENKKRTDSFSGVFESESLDRVLEILSFSGDFQFAIEGRVVTLEFTNLN